VLCTWSEFNGFANWTTHCYNSWSCPHNFKEE
jgi:hypothetical protein